MLDIKLKLKPGHTSERLWMESLPLKTLFWNMTYACNYNCSICFTDSGNPRPDELTTGEAMEVVDRIHAANVHDVIISGGEPFMRKDIVEILSYMGNKGISLRIASNGFFLTDQLLTQLRRATLTKSFQISIDTLDPDLYQDFHRAPPGALQSVLGALRRIKKHGFHTTISVRLTPETLPGIPRLLDLASIEEWSTVTIHCPVHIQRIEGAFPQDEDVLTLLQPVFQHFCGLKERWLVEMYIPWAEYHPVMRRLEKEVRVIYRGCRAGRDRLTIHPSGQVSPCVCMDVPAAYLGNVREDDLTELFNNSSICDMMRRPQEYGICRDCGNVEKCGGGCRAAAFALTGQVDGQDKSCPVWQSRAANKADAHGRS
jgi:radical SAM protein with 4Fe4S-binding SPASM domain